MRFAPICTRFLRINVLSLAGLMLALGIITPQPSQGQGPVLYTVAQNEAFLRTVDPVSGTTLSNVTINLPGPTPITNSVGLALNPANGMLFALIVEGGFTNPALVTIDPSTGDATVIGETEDDFTDIAFSPNGSLLPPTLYGVTSQAATDPNALYTLSTTDATGVAMGTFNTGTAGTESIAFNANDGLIYHTSGVGLTTNTDEILETVDPLAFSPTAVTLSLDEHDGINGLTHWTEDIFLAGAVPPGGGMGLAMLRSNGRLRGMALVDHLIAGLAVVGSPPTCPPLGNLYGAAFQGPAHRPIGAAR